MRGGPRRHWGQDVGRPLGGGAAAPAEENAGAEAARLKETEQQERAKVWAQLEAWSRWDSGSYGGSCSGFQTSTLAENLVSTAVSVMRILQPRYTCSDLLALDSVMQEHLRRDYQGQKAIRGLAGSKDSPRHVYSPAPHLSRRALSPPRTLRAPDLSQQ